MRLPESFAALGLLPPNVGCGRVLGFAIFVLRDWSRLHAGDGCVKRRLAVGQHGG